MGYLLIFPLVIIQGSLRYRIEYYLDHEDALVLTTEYETMTIHERFWFVTDDIRLRASTVQRFGGFNTATFCIEVRDNYHNQAQADNQEDNKALLDTPAITGW